MRQDPIRYFVRRQIRCIDLGIWQVFDQPESADRVLHSVCVSTFNEAKLEFFGRRYQVQLMNRFEGIPERGDHRLVEFRSREDPCEDGEIAVCLSVAPRHRNDIPDSDLAGSVYSEIW